jgi:hypothetical protein
MKQSRIKLPSLPRGFGRAEHDFQASRLSITHTRNRCCQAKLEHGREDAAARSEGNPTLRCCAAGEQSSARPTPYQYRPHCRFKDIQTSKRSSLYPYSPCSHSTRREATRRLVSARPICRQDVTEILRNHSVKLPQAMRHDCKETRSICASAWQLKFGGSDQASGTNSRSPRSVPKVRCRGHNSSSNPELCQKPTPLTCRRERTTKIAPTEADALLR